MAKYLKKKGRIALGGMVAVMALALIGMLMVPEMGKNLGVARAQSLWAVGEINTGSGSGSLIPPPEPEEEPDEEDDYYVDWCEGGYFPDDDYFESGSGSEESYDLSDAINDLVDWAGTYLD